MVHATTNDLRREFATVTSQNSSNGSNRFRPGPDTNGGCFEWYEEHAEPRAISSYRSTSAAGPKASITLVTLVPGRLIVGWKVASTLRSIHVSQS
jgi:hypothetical protein